MLSSKKHHLGRSQVRDPALLLAFGRRMHPVICTHVTRQTYFSLGCPKTLPWVHIYDTATQICLFSFTDPATISALKDRVEAETILD